MMVMLLLKKHHRNRGKRIWQKKENVLNVSIAKEIGAGTATESESM